MTFRILALPPSSGKDRTERRRGDNTPWGPLNNAILDASYEAFNGGGISSGGLLGCEAAQCCGRIPTFRRSMLPPSSQ
jgi:hypothetical protein